MRALIVKIQYVLWALFRINKPHIGDIVKLKSTGEVFWLVQGVSNPYWDLHNQRMGRVKQVHKSRFKLLHPIKGRIERFNQSYRFQKQNWYSIDVWLNKKMFSRISYKGN